MQDSLNCHRRKGGKEGEKADVPEKKQEVSRREDCAAGRAVPGARACSPATARLYGAGEASCKVGGPGAPYLLVHDGASHLPDMRQAVVARGVLKEQHRLAAQADLQMERDAPGRGGPRRREGRGPGAGDQSSGSGGHGGRGGQERARRPQQRRGAHRASEPQSLADVGRGATVCGGREEPPNFPGKSARGDRARGRSWRGREPRRWPSGAGAGKRAGARQRGGGAQL